MAEYNIEVTLYKTALAEITAEQIVDALESLTGNDRLDASAVKNLPDGSGVVEMTGEEIVDAINLLGGAEPRILDGQTDVKPKSRVTHCEKALNNVGIYDPRSASFQGRFQAPNTDRIKAYDFVIVAEVYQPAEIFQNGDWVIAIQDDPGFTYSDTAKWLIVSLSKLQYISQQYLVFKRNAPTSIASGIESIGGTCAANGAYSTALGRETVSQGQNSLATGYKSKALRQGDIAENSGAFVSAGDAQRSRSHMKVITQNSIPTLLATPFQYGFEENKTYLLEIRILAVVKGGAKAKSWKYIYLTGVDSTGAVPVSGGLDTILEDENIQYGSPAISCSVLVTEFDAVTPPGPGVFKGLQIRLTGIANTQVYWQVFIDAFESTSL